MDDSERSYGYSEDIYHGENVRDAKESYEYGPESLSEEAEDLSPEEEAIHIEGPPDDDTVRLAEEKEYDYNRDDKVPVESFTWDLEPEETHTSGGAAGEGEKSGKR